MAGDQVNEFDVEKKRIRVAIHQIRQQITVLRETEDKLTTTLCIMENNLAKLYDRIGDDWK